MNGVLCFIPILIIPESVQPLPSRSEFLVVDIEFLHAQTHDSVRKTELGGGFGHVAFGAFERFDDHLLFDRIELLLQVADVGRAA